MTDAEFSTVDATNMDPRALSCREPGPALPFATLRPLLATSGTRPLSLLQLDFMVGGRSESAAVVGVIVV
ncbi:MAG TPA: hypothetical protein VFC51_10255 [Chloroflexota bacterium]|nr:hypothetical protein [Chloroflexota bacterium]